MPKKIVCIIHTKEKRIEAEKLAVRRKEQGEETEICSAAEGSLDERMQELLKKDEILFVTDHDTTAQMLSKLGVPVLAYLHEGNGGETFAGIRYAAEELAELESSYLEQIYCRMKGLPYTVIQTARCILRETIAEDVEEFYRIYEEPCITYYMENLFEDPNEEIAYVKAYADNIYRFYGYGIWTVVLKENGRIIGRAGVDQREGFDTPDLGFLIAVPYQRQGYAAEVCRAILEYGAVELGFSSVQALVRKQNTASVRLCRSLGFEWEECVQDNGIEYERYLYRICKNLYKN